MSFSNLEWKFLQFCFPGFCVNYVVYFNEQINSMCPLPRALGQCCGKMRMWADDVGDGA